MISIDGNEDIYVLDLNDYDVGNVELTVNSTTTWVVYYVSTDLLDVFTFSNNKLSINTDLSLLKDDAFIILRNLNKEKINIIVKPNLEKSREKKYIFKLGKHTINGNIITLNIISKENGQIESWKIIRDGQPITYNISKTKTKLTIKLTMILGGEVLSNFELLQNNSGNIIKFRLKHKDNDSVELIENKEAD